MTLTRLFAALALLLSAVPAAAETVASAASPSGTLKLKVTLNGEGRIGYAVSRMGQPVIAESHLDFLLSDAPQLLRNFQKVGEQKRSVDDTWEQPWGEWRTVRDRYNELSVTFEEKTKLKRRMTIVFRAFDDGLGFRYQLPAQPNLARAKVVEELTQFNFVEPGAAWWAPAFESNREEYLYNRTPIDGVGIAQTPFTIRSASGLHVAIHEAALVDYSGMNVARVQGGNFKAMLTPSSTGPKVVRDTPFATPWRVILITPDAPSLYAANTLILNLNEPNALGDVSWVRPRKYVGIWWDAPRHAKLE